MRASELYKHFGEYLTWVRNEDLWQFYSNIGEVVVVVVKHIFKFQMENTLFLLSLMESSVVTIIKGLCIGQMKNVEQNLDSLKLSY